MVSFTTLFKGERKFIRLVFSGHLSSYIKIKEISNDSVNREDSA